MRAGEVARRWTPTVSRRERAEVVRVRREGHTRDRIPSRRGTGPSGPSGDGQLDSSDEVARAARGDVPTRCDAIRSRRAIHTCVAASPGEIWDVAGFGDVPSTVAGV